MKRVRAARIVISRPSTHRRRRAMVQIALALMLLGPAGCGDDVPLDGDGGNNGDGGGLGDGGNNGDGGLGDGGFPGTDADPGGECTAESTQCNNCIDDDKDGTVDGFDIECTSAADDDEGSFATGIPGDNMDQVNQDCFFDGDSGAGNDGCNQHVCCFLDECPDGLPGGEFDPVDDCPELSDECIETCGALTPPGCDCFGCCTVCDGDFCVDVSLNPQTSPDCDADVLDDPELCPTCTKVEDCGTPCDPEGCILCPGQTEDDLPPECVEPECPGGGTPCTDSEECGGGFFCSNGCCINAIP